MLHPSWEGEGDGYQLSEGALWRDPETPYGVRVACLKGKDDLMSDGKGLRDVRTSAVWCSGREMADALAKMLWNCFPAHFTIN